MLALIDAVADERTVETSAGVTTIDFVLPNVTPIVPPTTPAPHGTGYALLRGAAEDAIDWTDAVRRLWRRD
jgi:hypothetical protein